MFRPIFKDMSNIMYGDLVRISDNHITLSGVVWARGYEEICVKPLFLLRLALRLDPTQP